MTLQLPTHAYGMCEQRCGIPSAMRGGWQEATRRLWQRGLRRLGRDTARSNYSVTAHHPCSRSGSLCFSRQDSTVCHMAEQWNRTQCRKML
eukprot:3600002-Amphidinium_carterae.1